MDVLQEELNDIRDMWNVHRIRADRARRVSGIPDELFYLPELKGVCLVIVATSCSMYLITLKSLHAGRLSQHKFSDNCCYIINIDICCVQLCSYNY